MGSVPRQIDTVL